MIDRKTVLAKANLLKVVEQDLGPAEHKSGGWWFWKCPFHAQGQERTASLSVTPDNGRWHCFSCWAHGNAIDWMMRFRGLLFVDACEQLGFDRRSETVPVSTGQPERRPAAPDVEPPGAGWQERAQAFVNYAHEQLRGEAGESARSYLRTERGLKEETIRTWSLGYNPQKIHDQGVDRWGVVGRSVYLSPGIVIPCKIDGVLWYIQIRRPYVPEEGGEDSLAACLGYTVDWRPERKYFAVKGGEGPALYGADKLQGTPLLLFCEGEFDALLAWQELHDLVDVVTMGGSMKGSSGLPGRWLVHLAPYRAILVAYDADGSGQRGAKMLTQQSSRVHSITVPAGGDIVGFWQQGGDLRAWLLGELDRLGLDTAGRSGEMEADGERGRVGAPPADGREAGGGDQG